MNENSIAAPRSIAAKWTKSVFPQSTVNIMRFYRGLVPGSGKKEPDAYQKVSAKITDFLALTSMISGRLFASFDISFRINYLSRISRSVLCMP